MINRYAGEIRINPVPILRNDDFNNDGAIDDIGALLEQALEVNKQIAERIKKLKAYFSSNAASRAEYLFSEGGYIQVKGLSDEELLAMNASGLIDLFDFATEREWVKRYGAMFGLTWENGRAVPMD